MLYGTDLNHAFSFSVDQAGGKDRGYEAHDPYHYTDTMGSKHKDEYPKHSKQGHKEKEPIMAPSSVSEIASIPPHTHMPPSFHPTPDEKLERMAIELQTAREIIDKNNNDGYVDKMMSKRRDVLKIFMFSCIVLLALSIHYVTKYYYKSYFAEAVLTPTKEFFLRAAYPMVVLFVLWNIRALSATPSRE